MSDRSHQPLLESRSMRIDRDARRGTLELIEGAGYSGSEAMPSVEPNRPHSDLLLRNDTSESDASQKENIRRKTNFRGTPVDTTRANQVGKLAEQAVKRVVEQAVDRDAHRGTLLQT